jgi:hypothetical protein
VGQAVENSEQELAAPPVVGCRSPALSARSPELAAGREGQAPRHCSCSDPADTAGRSTPDTGRAECWTVQSRFRADRRQSARGRHVRPHGRSSWSWQAPAPHRTRAAAGAGSPIARRSGSSRDTVGGEEKQPAGSTPVRVPASQRRGPPPAPRSARSLASSSLRAWVSSPVSLSGLASLSSFPQLHRVPPGVVCAVSSTFIGSNDSEVEKKRPRAAFCSSRPGDMDFLRWSRTAGRLAATLSFFPRPLTPNPSRPSTGARGARHSSLTPNPPIPKYKGEGRKKRLAATSCLPAVVVCRSGSTCPGSAALPARPANATGPRAETGRRAFC